MHLDSLPLLSSRSQVQQRVERCLQASSFSELSLERLACSEEALEYLQVEMPALFLLDLADPTFDSFGVIEAILADPWLMDGGVIVIHAGRDTLARLETRIGLNLIIALEETEIERYLAVVLGIVSDNQRLMHQRGLGSDLISNFAASFRLPNEPLVARCYVNLLCNFLYNARRFDLQQKAAVHLALMELLLNAIEHGNCGISYAEKSACLESGRAIADLVRERNARPQIKARQVSFEYRLGPEHADFTIADQGDGFDWRNVRDPLADENLLAMHGRGIAMARQVCSTLEYNDCGNEVRFSVPYGQGGESSMRPGLFKGRAVRETRPGEVIFTAGERSDHLYYIAKGEFDVQVQGRKVGGVNADDIFIGEMSFLMNSRRTATVVARDAGHLIAISRQEFVAGIRANPQYALFLARLMAQRVARLNEQAATGE